MTHRTFDEQIANFNRVVSSWDINQEYKVALLGMTASLGHEHEKSITPEPHWISCKKELPKLDSRCVLLYSNDNISGGYYRGNRTFDVDYGDEDVNTMVIAWMPEPIRG